MKYIDYVNRPKDYKTYVIGGSHFTYKGVQYGKGTKIKFTNDFSKRFIRHTMSKNEYWNPKYDWRLFSSYYQETGFFHSINIVNGKENWICGMLAGTGMEVVPDRDIDEIIRPVYYVEPPTPKELFHQRMHDGTWINYIGHYILIYVLWLLFCLISYQWLVGWIMGTYVFLHLSYLKLSGQE